MIYTKDRKQFFAVYETFLKGLVFYREAGEGKVEIKIATDYSYVKEILNKMI